MTRALLLTPDLTRICDDMLKRVSEKTDEVKTWPVIGWSVGHLLSAAAAAAAVHHQPMTDA